MHIGTIIPDMHGYIQRVLEQTVQKALQAMPAVAILGPRQCGKSTLARNLVRDRSDVVYLDLERPADLAKLDDPETFFSVNADRLVCIDEVQRAPDLFSVMRYVIDQRSCNGQFLILGSASRDLIQQSSETLAGRVRFLELSPFLWQEIGGEDLTDLRRIWLRGGFPRSYLAQDDSASFEWRQDFIRSFLERDLLALKPGIPPRRMSRLWTMCAHGHGQTVNYAKLAGALDLDAKTARSYLELLEGGFMLRLLPPFFANLKKRLVKSPKLYVRDSGVLHALAAVTTMNDLLGRPWIGASWEGFVVDNILAASGPAIRASFFRTSGGAEVDLVLERGDVRIAVECKASSSPKPERGFWNAIEDIGAARSWIIAPIADAYPIRENVWACPLHHFLRTEQTFLG